jgi:hypothetical protein
MDEPRRTQIEALARGYVNRAIVLYRRAAECAPSSDQRDDLLREAARLEGVEIEPRDDDPPAIDASDRP